MTTHPLLRAYLAGVALPTFLTPVGLGVFALARFGFGVPVPIERVIIFPLASLPIIWGAWNVLYFLLGTRLRMPIGVFGMFIFVFFGPLAYFLIPHVLPDLGLILPRLLPAAIPAGLLAYYLLWKYVVSYFNRVLGLA